MTVDESVEPAQRVGLLETAIGLDCRGTALVAKKKPDGLIFSRMSSQEQLRREMAEHVGVENDFRLLDDRVLDLLGKLRWGLGAALARREQVSVGVLDQDRPTPGQIDVYELAKAVRNLEGERAPVLCLLGWHDKMANATGASPNDM